MRTPRRFFPLALAFALAIPAGLQAAPRGGGGQSPLPPGVAAIEITSSRLEGSPVLSASGEAILLTVAGPQGFYFEKRFPRGAAPAFDLADARDGAPADGTYTFELRTLGKGPGKVQSGAFSVREGRIFVPQGAAGDTKPPASKGKPVGPPLQLKEIIAEGTCIGDGCETGDEGLPLQLKSSLVRLDLTDDTDGISEDHDWAIEANAAIGGGAYLAFIDRGDPLTRPFKVVAGAPDDSLLVSSSGRVGIGTATPAVQLDAKISSSGNAVARVQNSSSGGYSAIEYLDHSGNVDLFFGIDNANSTTRLNSLNSNPITLLTNSTERMRITSGGDVGIGASSPADRLDVRCSNASAGCFRVMNASGSGYAGMEAFDESGASVFFLGADNTNNFTRFNSVNNNPIVFLMNSTERLRFPNSGNVITAANGAFLSNGGTWTNASSRVLKQDVHDLDASAALATVKGLNPVQFAYKSDPAEHHVGFIAEDVPDLVAENDRKGLSPMDVVAVLTKVVQEQQKTIEALNARLEALEHKP